MEEKRNAWDEAKFREVLKRAGRTIQCSWGVAGIRDKKTGEMQTVLLFDDEEHGQFSYSFSFSHREEVAMLCTNLMQMADKIHKGKFGK